MEKLKSLLLKAWFLSLVLSVVVIFFIPDIFDKYKIKLIDSSKLQQGPKTKIYAHDLDHDGLSEKIYSFEFNGKHSIQVHSPDGGIVDQWNTDGNIINSDNRLVCGDFDLDGFSEVYTLYEKNDSIQLYCFEPFDTISPRFNKAVSICSLETKYAKPDPSIISLLFQDVSGDGKGDLLFTIVAGQARFPRNVFLYDIFNDTVIQSADYGSVPNVNLELFDLNGDDKLEIFGSLIAAGQIHDSLGFEFSDYDAWLMVYDNKLDLLFKPLKFSGFRTSIFVEPVIIDGSEYLVAYDNHLGPLENRPKLILVNGKGQIINEYIFPISSKSYRWLNVGVVREKTIIQILEENGIVSVFNENFELMESIDLGHAIKRSSIKAELNNKGDAEWVFFLKNGDLMVTQADYSEPCYYPLDFEPHGRPLLVKNSREQATLVLLDDKLETSFIYIENPYYRFQYIIYVGIYLCFWLFIISIRKLQLIQLRKKEGIRNQIVNLQLKSYGNQMDPHFTFNVFNTMAYQIKKDNPESYGAFMDFSNLIRKMLLSSDRITRCIEDELSQLESYLNLESMRFPNQVFYKIHVESDVDQKMHIPKMILQIYVENAIKHGIMHKEGQGQVSIQIRKLAKDLEIEIKDDGIGRKKAKEISTANSNGFGLKIMDNYISLFNTYNISKISSEIHDIYDDANLPMGTKVLIYIPLNFSYRLGKLEK